MAKFTTIGRLVTHHEPPRCTIQFQPNADGGWNGHIVEWIDPPGIDHPAAAARRLARLMREAGDFFSAQIGHDWIQEAVIARVAELGLSSYEIAKRTGRAVSEDHVQAYLQLRKSMGSHKLQHVLAVLGITLTAGHRPLTIDH